MKLPISEFASITRGLLIYRRYRRLTMIPALAYAENLSLVSRIARRVAGDIVECGTWKGGMSAGMIAITNASRAYHFFDSFAGLPDAQEIDGASALEYQRRTDAASYYQNCTASEAEFRSLLSHEFPRAKIDIYPGWFEQTMARVPKELRIAVLRLDADWYESTMTCLEALYDRVLRGGVIIVDDYHTWDGCAKAVHDFLSRRKDGTRLFQSPLARFAYLVRR